MENIEITDMNLNIDDFLSDKLIQKSLHETLWADLEECELEFESGSITVPSDSALEVISKSFRKNIYKVGFGDYYAAQVAIGGVKEISGGVLYPLYCFATLFYTPERNLITTDIHLEMR